MIQNFAQNGKTSPGLDILS